MQAWFRSIQVAIFLSIAALRPAMGETVDLELILAIDVSGSIDGYEARLQRRGYVEALVHPAVIKAIRSGKHRRIALAYMEYAGIGNQHTIIDWTVIRSAKDARKVAARLAKTPLNMQVWTSISGGIDYAMKLFKRNPHRGARRVLDVSGDGPNNAGRKLKLARAEALARGVTINGLPIVNDRRQPWTARPPRELVKYYANKVIGGRGSFLIVAKGFKAFGKAIRNKLVREIAARPLERAAIR